MNISCTQAPVRYLINSTLVKLQKVLYLSGTHFHFESEGHNGFLEDVSVALIDKTDGSDPTKQETFWMHVLKTLVPYGLNIENGVLNNAAMQGGKSVFSQLGIVWLLDYMDRILDSSHRKDYDIIQTHMQDPVTPGGRVLCNIG